MESRCGLRRRAHLNNQLAGDCVTASRLQGARWLEQITPPGVEQGEEAEIEDGPRQSTDATAPPLVEILPQRSNTPPAEGLCRIESQQEPVANE